MTPVSLHVYPLRQNLSRTILIFFEKLPQQLNKWMRRGLQVIDAYHLDATYPCMLVQHAIKKYDDAEGADILKFTHETPACSLSAIFSRLIL